MLILVPNSKNDTHDLSMKKTSFSFKIYNTTTGELIAGNLSNPSHTCSSVELRRRIISIAELLYGACCEFDDNDDYGLNIQIRRIKNEPNLPFDVDVY